MILRQQSHRLIVLPTCRLLGLSENFRMSSGRANTRLAMEVAGRQQYGLCADCWASALNRGITVKATPDTEMSADEGVVETEIESNRAVRFSGNKKRRKKNYKILLHSFIISICVIYFVLCTHLIHFFLNLTQRYTTLCL